LAGAGLAFNRFGLFVAEPFAVFSALARGGVGLFGSEPQRQAASRAAIIAMFRIHSLTSSV
jgi:hypothetical protein